MKNYLLIIISIVLLIGCQLKKKTSEINTVDQQTVLQITEDVKTKTNLNVTHVDSSKIIKSNINNLHYSESMDIQFDMIPAKEKSISYNNNVTLFEQLLNKSQKVKIHINRIQQKSNSHLITQQNNIKSKMDSGVSRVGIYKQTHKADIKAKNKLISESKTYPTVTWWIIALGLLIIVYFLNKFNVPAIILRFFKP